VDDRCVIGRDSTVGALPESRTARDEDVVLVGRDSVVGADAGVGPGARLEPGTTA
jgi:glucose-1-phosphate adenylyltransferase